MSSSRKVRPPSAPPPINPVRGSYHSMSRNAPVDWDEWGDRLTAPLWQAIALSLDIEPETLDPGPEYKRRLSIACDHLEHGQLACKDASPEASQSIVDLAEVARWAANLKTPLGLPLRFPRPIAAPEPQSTLKQGIPAVPPAPRGFRTNHEQKAEEACGQWIAEQAERGVRLRKPKALKIAKEKWPNLSGLAFRRAWDNNAPGEWKKGGAPKKAEREEPPRP